MTNEPVGGANDYRAFWIAVSVVMLLGALFICFLAYFFYSFQFENDEGGRGLEGALLVLALAGLIPVLVMLARSIDGRAPGPWFVAALVAYTPFVTLYLIAAALY